jgi:hypothetical protein
MKDNYGKKRGGLDVQYFNNEKQDKNMDTGVHDNEYKEREDEELRRQAEEGLVC